ncbi:MAG: hypothetical protein J07HR59_01348 [Halorubrum sp. J07HR59]|nr:MAG: hypothetical protein J07HR59_01348 [Halorubrum sp. J07HR59]
MSDRGGVIPSHSAGLGELSGQIPTPVRALVGSIILSSKLISTLLPIIKFFICLLTVYGVILTPDVCSGAYCIRCFRDEDKCV